MIDIESLIDAVVAGDESALIHLISLGGDITEVDKNGLSLLHWCSSSAESELLTPLLICYGADLNCADVRGFTPLHYHAAYGRSYGTVCLLNQGANPNSLNDENYSPLHYAVKFNNSEIANILVAYGAVQ